MGKKNKYNVQQTDEYGQVEGMTENNTMNVASGTECTGMIPTPPGGCDDATSYREIYDVPVEQATVNTRPNGQSKKKNNK